MIIHPNLLNASLNPFKIKTTIHNIMVNGGVDAYFRIYSGFF